MRVLVTGGAGFVGSRLVAALAQRGHDTVALARQPVHGVPTVVADLATRPIQLPSIDAVVHLAQSRHYREFPGGAADMLAVNVDATFMLLEHARRVGASHFVFASTGAVYAPSTEPLREESALEPSGFYPRSKLAAELLVGGYARELVTAIVRPFAIYGEGQEAMLVANLAAQVLAGDEVVIEGSPGLRINPIHVDDAVRVFAAALELDRSTVVNLAGGEVVALADLIKLMAELCGREPRFRHSEGESPVLVGDIGRMRDVLGVTPSVALHAGLSRVIKSLAGRAP